MPLGYHAEVFSDLKGRQSANTRSLLYSLAVAAGIFLLLQAAFRSWSRAALLFLTLPLAAAGGLVAALLTDRLLTMGALLGFVVVLQPRPAQRHAAHPRLQRLEQREDDALQGTDLVLRAAREEAFPVVTTAVAVGLVLIPLPRTRQHRRHGDPGAALRGGMRRPGHLDAVHPLRSPGPVPPSSGTHVTDGMRAPQPRRHVVKHRDHLLWIVSVLVMGFGWRRVVTAGSRQATRPRQSSRRSPAPACNRVTLSQAAMEDLGIQSEPVRACGVSPHHGWPEADTHGHSGQGRVYDPRDDPGPYAIVAPRTFVSSFDRDRPYRRQRRPPALGTRHSTRP